MATSKKKPKKPAKKSVPADLRDARAKTKPKATVADHLGDARAKMATSAGAAISPETQALVDRVAAIDWNRVSGGQAEGFAEPFAILARGGKQSAKAEARIRSLLGDNGHTYPIAGLGFPFLIELLALAPSIDRAAILAYLTDAAMFRHTQWIGTGFEPPIHDGGLLDARARARTHAAFSAGAPLYRRLLEDDDPRVRAAAAFALGFVNPVAETETETPGVLRGALARETDASVRASLLLALAMRDRAAIGQTAAFALASANGEERLAAAIACSLGPDAAADTRVVAVLRAEAATKLRSPWFGGDPGAFVRRRSLVIVFGEPPETRPATPPVLIEAQRSVLRELLGEKTPADVTAFAKELGLPEADAALRRYAGMPRAIPDGVHGPIYDRWMTWAETGAPDATIVATEIAAEVAAKDFAAVVELMGFAEADHDDEIAGFAFPFAPALVPKPAKADDYNEPSSMYRYHACSVAEAVSGYEAALRAEGYRTWSHAPGDAGGDLYEGDVHGWHADGRQIVAGFRQADDLVRGLYEVRRSLLRPFAQAMVDRHGAEGVLASLQTTAKADMRAALVYLRTGWALTDHLKAPPDPISDEHAFTGGKGRSYIFAPIRQHLERLTGERRSALTLRLLKVDTDNLFEWAQFGAGPEIQAATVAMLKRNLGGTSYHDLETAERWASRMAPWVDDSVRKLLRKHVKQDKYPVVEVLLLARDGEWDAIRPALESQYPMSRAAARKVLAAAPKP